MARIRKRFSEERDPGMVREDVMDGMVSLAQAREVYRVVLDPETLELDLQETEKLRSAARRRKKG